jgi:hypothetical protein
MAIRFDEPHATGPVMLPSQTPGAAYDLELQRLARLNGTPEEELIMDPEVRAHMYRFMETQREGVEAPIIDKKTGKRGSVSIGAPGFETRNHLAAIRKYEGEIAYQKECQKILKRGDLEFARKLGIPVRERDDAA